MASNRNRRSARDTTKGTNAMGIQRKINSDYGALVRDYGKLFTEIWRKPSVRYVFGGLAVAALAPLAFRLIGRDRVPTFVIENLEGIRTKVQDYIPSRFSDSDTLNQ